MVLKSFKSNLKITEQHLLSSASANSACIRLKLERYMYVYAHVPDCTNLTRPVLNTY